jgi:hypothetical protein
MGHVPAQRRLAAARRAERHAQLSEILREAVLAYLGAWRIT